jgi:GNAT superfamily N-acetyltransferase
VTIRRATPADAAAIAGVQVRGSEWAYRGLLPEPTVPTDERIAQRIAAWLPQLADDSDRHSFVAEQDGAVIGFVTVGPTDDEAQAAATGELFAIYLESQVVGTGVGRALLARAEGELAARGFVVAVLWVLDGNARARQFYERAGWDADGGRRESARDGHTRREVRYRRALAAQS